MTYRDMTFCTCWKRCAKGATCDRACTDEVKADAAQVGAFLSMSNFEGEGCFEPLPNGDGKE